MRILNTSWGGRGEHSILEVMMDVEDDKMILSLHESGYNDWGGSSQLDSEKNYSKCYNLENHSLSKKYIYECVLDMVRDECGMIYYRIDEEDIMYQKVTIGIRADGNATLGMGHLMRCGSIAKALEKQGAECIFFVAEEQAGQFLQEKGFRCEVLDTDYLDMEAELPKLKEVATKYSISLWLVDSYQITQNYLRQLRAICPVFYLDDTGEKLLEADGLINYNIYGDELGYEDKCPTQMKLLLGAGYAPLKEEFVRTPYALQKEVHKILITMGGSDTLNITGAISQCLLQKLPEEIELTLICGRFNPHLQELLQLQEENSRVQVLVDVVDMWNKLAAADIAVSAGGSTMYELSAMGVPTVCCYYVENQRRIAEGFAGKVGLCNAGDYSVEPEATLARMVEAVCELVTNKTARESLSLRMKQVADGQGAMRLAKALLEEVK